MIKKFLAAVAMATVMLTGAISSILPPVTVEAAQKTNFLLCNEDEAELELKPGEKQTFTRKVKALQIMICNPKLTAIVPEDAPYEVLDLKVFELLNGKRSYDNVYINTDSNAEKYIEFTVKTKDTAKVGKYKFDVKYTSYVGGLEVEEDETSELLQRLTFTGIVSDEKIPAELSISGVKTTKPLTPGSTSEVSFQVTNMGELVAKNVRVSANFDGQYLLPDYSDYTKRVGNLEAGQSGTVTLQLKVLPEATGHLLTLPLNISFKDSEGNSFSVTENNLLYLELIGGEKKEEAEKDLGMLLVSNVRQNPAQPKPGENVTLTFDLQNTGELDFTEMRMMAGYTAEVGFEPVNAELYQYVGTIGAGGKKTVSITVKAGKNISAGLNTITMNFSYFDGKKNAQTASTGLYVLDVQSKEESLGNSKPKLMVSEFKTSTEDIKTGEEFDFTFSVFNTHSETAAKNIKVTVNSDTFSVTKGSNSFFISKIEPEETGEITINLKANASAMTGSYPINIQIEYEYDGMPNSSDASMNGVSVTETKMLLVKENLRITLENISVGSWLGATIDQACPLTFSVYNMGKSPLNNVYFTVDGDFMISNGSSYYYGTLQPGYPDYVEAEVLPLVGGDAHGILTIHMEDSNGEEVTEDFEINAFVNEGGNEPYIPDDPTGPDVPADIEPSKEVKAVISLPIFIVILVALFFAGLFVARGIMIVCYKKKQKKDAE